MADKFKFPNGEEVEICRKQDILDAINDNILDKNIALEIIERCEQDAIRFLNEGRWTGIPYMGNIRKPKGIEIENSEENKKLIEEAKLVLEHDQYVLFRKQLVKDNKEKIARNRYYKYCLAKICARNKNTYKYLCNTHGEIMANFIMYCRTKLTVIYAEQFDN